MIGTLLLFGTLAFFFVLVLRRGRGGRSEGGDAQPAKTALDAWVEEQVAVAVARRVGAGRDAVLTALRGDPDPELVSSMEQAVRGIQLEYEHLAYAGEAELHVVISFESGAPAEARKRWKFEELPQAIRDELARTGASRVYRAWEFPWSEPESPI